MIIIIALYFFLPAYLANMAPVFAAKIFGRHFAAPIDGGRNYRGKRIFGDHKTWRGLVAGIVLAILTVYIQRLLFERSLAFRQISMIDYAKHSVLILGFLFGFGALAGDAIKSFFKRQIGKEPGAAWPGFDQLDFVVGGLLAVAIVFPTPLIIVLILLIISPVLHLLVNIIGHKLKLKDNPW